MARLEELLPKTVVRGILPDEAVSVVNVQWHGSDALELIYKTATGAMQNRLLYRDDEPRLSVVEQGRPWSFDGDGATFRLVSEAQRIRLAHFFGPARTTAGGIWDPASKRRSTGLPSADLAGRRAGESPWI